MTTATLRLQLRDAGYHPLPCEGKRPSMPEWPSKLNCGAEEIRLWDKQWRLAQNTGILARNTPAIDIDIMHVTAAEAVEALAREHFEERGNILVRIGLPPKRLIPLRTDEPFTKLLRVFTAPNGHEHKIEILGDGQQWIADGIHPTTGLPYDWQGSTLAMTSREDLPYVRRADMEKFLDDATRLLIEEFGFTIAGGTQNAANGAAPRQAAADTAWGQLNERALANLDRWVPKLFPTAKRTSTGGYRVTSADLGRGLQEDLSLTKAGIKYFGVADMGDPRQGRRTPIDIVMEWQHLDFGPATLWLLQALDEEQPEAPNEAPNEQSAEEAKLPPEEESPQAEAPPQAKAPSQTLPPPTSPMAVARVFVKHCCTHNGAADELTLRHWGGAWWSWRTTHWSEIKERVVRSWLYGFTEGAFFLDEKGNLRPWGPTRRRIGDLLEALAAIVLIVDDFEQPCWLDDRETDGPIVAVANGLLTVATRGLHPHSPLYFNQTSVPFAYEPDAPRPQKWLEFLDELWPDLPAAVDALGEWYGYVISGRTDLHKILLVVGPTRGGKGVIARILTALIGKRNMCGPTLHSLGSEFGLAPLLGKSLAVISDARFVGKNAGVVVERLLSISGEDTLTINVKYQEQVSCKLSTRLHVMSNELPKLGDASTAIVGRIVLLPLSRSWLGKENIGLESLLRAELPGILNWALDGLERLALTNEGRFTRVEAAEEAVIAMRDLASPVGAFVRECCTVRPFHAGGGNREIGVDELYAAYKAWCEESEIPKSSKAVFGRDLRAAVPSIRKIRPRGTIPRKHVYAGISLCTPADSAEAEAETRKAETLV